MNVDRNVPIPEEKNFVEKKYGTGKIKIGKLVDH